MPTSAKKSKVSPEPCPDELTKGKEPGKVRIVLE